MSVTPVVVICDGIGEDVCTIGSWIWFVSVISIFIDRKRAVFSALRVSPSLIVWVYYPCVSIVCTDVVVGKLVSIND